MAFTEEFHHLKIQLEEIKLATDNFDDNSLIGTGGFGKVYKGAISHSKGQSMAAFKRLDRIYGQGNSEFWKEIMMLSRYTHENLVSLLGFCDEGGEKIVVYEHESRGSLDHHLSATTLTWTHRLKICLAAARGLSYLHDPKGTQQRLLHCDIKSSNILLDKNWNAKVSDFGLSKICPANQQYTVLVTNAAGTRGYIDPQYLEMDFLTKESDVYSFGVVLFEVLCGRLCYEYSNGRFQILVPMWKQSYEEKKLDEIIFQDLMQQMDLRSLKTFSDIAYQCLQRSREKRPTMAHVVEKLELALEFQKRYDVKLPKEYEEKIKATVPPLIYSAIEELNMLLSKGVLLNGGKTVEHELLEVENIDMQAISDSDTDWEQKLPNDYEEIIKWSKDSVQWTTKTELYFLLCKGFLINNGEEWFSLAKNGKKCHMLPARAALLKEQWNWKSLPESRFEEVAVHPNKSFSIICKIKSQILSPQTTYASYLVYKLSENHSKFEWFSLKVTDKNYYLNVWKGMTHCRFIYLLSPQTPVIRPKFDQNTHNPLNRPKMKGLPQLRNDGWMEVQVWEFQTGTTTKIISMRVDLETCSYRLIDGLTVQGIEFKPI